MPIFMESDPIHENSNTGNPKSYAYQTARTRWPKIWSSAISAIQTTIDESKLSDQDEIAGEIIISKLAALKESLASNAPLEPIADDGSSDIEDYNTELLSFGNLTWLAAPWLFAECYIYRLVYTFFSTSSIFWQSHDIFYTEKCQSLVASHVGTIELSKRFGQILGSLRSGDRHLADEQTTEKALFDEMVQIALWGNATDLTLLSSLSVDEVQSRQGKKARDASREHIVVNDTGKVWALLSSLKNGKCPSTGVIHIVLDNSGFEMLADLVVASYLLEKKFADMIVLHGKAMPWFVSDVNARELEWLVSSFAKGTYYPEAASPDKELIQKTGTYWRELLSSKKIEFRAHPFWRTQHSFGRMPVLQPELFAGLAGADLIIFKGDLNYRKLTHDGDWPKTTPFSKAMGPFAKMHGEKGVRTLVLRTCKADVCVGLRAEQEEKLEEGWTRYGKYGVISYWDAKAAE